MEPNRSPHSSHLPNSSWPSHLYHHPHWLSSPAAASSSTLSFGTRTQTDHLDLDEDLDESESMSQTQTQGHGYQQAQNDVVHTPPDLVPDHDKEPMFEKPLTPSDVGKLNRLVIPKQHAEKHFPLSGGDGGEKGLLLSFEDEGGRTWRFRYSYWNSSQSYVLTKGWSRFVKEKRLDAGDVVSFERHRRDGSRLFIGWRRRTTGRRADGGGIAAGGLTAQHGPGGGGWTRYYNAQAYPAHPPLYQHQHHLPDHCLPTGMPVAQDQAAPAGNSSRRRLRLFGVNLECQPDGWAEPSEPEGSTVRSQGPAHEQPHAQLYAAAPSDSLYYHMDMNFSRDINQM